MTWQEQLVIAAITVAGFILIPALTWYVITGRREVFKQLDHERSIERVRAGLSELSHAPGPADPMPDSLVELSHLFPKNETRFRRELQQLHSSGVSWEICEKWARKQIEAQAPGLLERIGV